MLISVQHDSCTWTAIYRRGSWSFCCPSMPRWPTVMCTSYWRPSHTTHSTRPARRSLTSLFMLIRLVEISLLQLFMANLLNRRGLQVCPPFVCLSVCLSLHEISKSCDNVNFFNYVHETWYVNKWQCVHNAQNFLSIHSPVCPSSCLLKSGSCDNFRSILRDYPWFF